MTWRLALKFFRLADKFLGMCFSRYPETVITRFNTVQVYNVNMPSEG